MHRSRGDLTADDLPDVRSKGIDVLVVRSTKVTADTIDQLRPSSCLIVRSGAGTNTIDCEAAANAGIYVCNVPGTNSLAVAELTIGLLLAIDRHIADATANDLRRGTWNKDGVFSRSDGIFGKTLGIIGVGEIGMAVAERARGFGLIVSGGAQGRADKPETEARIRASRRQASSTASTNLVARVRHHLGPRARKCLQRPTWSTPDFLDKMKPGSPS